MGDRNAGARRKRRGVQQGEKMEGDPCKRVAEFGIRMFRSELLESHKAATREDVAEAEPHGRNHGRRPDSGSRMVRAFRQRLEQGVKVDLAGGVALLKEPEIKVIQFSGIRAENASVFHKACPQPGLQETVGPFSDGLRIRSVLEGGPEFFEDRNLVLLERDQKNGELTVKRHGLGVESDERVNGGKVSAGERGAVEGALIRRRQKCSWLGLGLPGEVPGCQRFQEGGVGVPGQKAVVFREQDEREERPEKRGARFRGGAPKRPCQCGGLVPPEQRGCQQQEKEEGLHRPRPQ
jgi:hypothetical protein